MEGESREQERDRTAAEPQPFTWPILGTLYASVMAATVVAILDTDFGRDLQDRLSAPARALVAVPVLVLCLILFCASLLALVAPAYRRRSMRVAEITAWVIPAWLLMSGLVLGALAYALARLD
jgi:hypothetical protein